MRQVATWIFILIWFLQLGVGTGAGYAAYRLWPERANPFVKRTLINLHSTMLIALAAVVLLFMAKGVRFTWKFSITLFTFMLLWNLAVLPLILFVLRGPKASE